MPLPNLPSGYHEQALEVLRRNLPGQWFQAICSPESRIYPLLRGVAFALAHLRYSYEQALNAAIPATSAGAWLSLHLQSIGLVRRSGETDAAALVRYQQEFAQTKNTRSGLLRTLSSITGLSAPQIRLETDYRFGRFGEFRVVIDAKTVPWNEVDLGFIGDFLRRFVANGISPSLNAEMQCLLYQQARYWRFSDSFPPRNITGPWWERRNFISIYSLPNARNLIAQVSVSEWASQRDRLEAIYQNGRVDGAPGAFLLYLTDAGQCPYIEAEYSINLSVEDSQGALPDLKSRVDGIRFDNQLPSFLPIQGGNLLAPEFASPVPALGVVIPLPTVALAELVLPPEISGDSQQRALLYYGKSFTRWQVTEVYESQTPPTVVQSPELVLMQSGPWELVITEGDASWGDIPPQGSALVGTPIATLDPKTVYWTDYVGDRRESGPVWDASQQAVFMAAEFMLPSGTARTIRELELRLDGERVAYRRFSLRVPENISFALLFRVAGLPLQTQYLFLGDGVQLLALGGGFSFVEL